MDSDENRKEAGKWKHSPRKKQPAEKRTYTVKEISKMLGISENACYAFVKEMKDEFRSVRIGTSIRVSKKSFDKWLDEQEM